MLGFRRLIGKFALVSVSVLLCAGGVELVLRGADIGYPIFSAPDPVTGFSQRPGAHGRFRAEGESFVSISSAGLRDREHPLEKPAGLFRIAVLGDSYAEAMQVEVEEAFWAVSERRLAGCPGLGGKHVETINFGVAGFGTAQELLVWRARARAYQPDLVLLAFVHNDVRNNSRGLERDDGRPYFDLIDGGLVLDDSFLRTETYRLRTSRWRILRRDLAGSSRLLQVVNDVAQIPARRELARTQQPISRFMYSEPSDPAWVEAWAVTDALVVELAKEVAESGSRFLLVTTTDWPQVHPDPEFREQFAIEHGVQDYEYSENRLASVANSAGIEFLALAPDLRAKAQAAGECLHGFANAKPCAGHWNARGHELGGQSIAGRICGMLGEPLEAAGFAERPDEMRQ